MPYLFMSNHTPNQQVIIKKYRSQFFFINLIIILDQTYKNIFTWANIF